MKVLKFGGSSVGSAEAIEKVVAIIASSSAVGRCAIVFSAMQGTTDELIAAGRSAERGDDGYIEVLIHIGERHTDAINKLFPNGNRSDIAEFVESTLKELENICEGVRLVRELSAKTLDRILSFGEIVSSRMISAKLDEQAIANKWYDSRQLIRTNSSHGNAIVDFAETNERLNGLFENSSSNVFILPGFVASDKAGHTTTLGRGGSDYTGAIIAAAGDADVIEIWTDVSGMMTADPRFVRNVREISHITYREAMELSHFGAKVIYPPTIQPVMAKGIPILVKNTFEPAAAGTLIESESSASSQMIRGITSIDNITVLSLEGSGMVGIPGFSKRLFDALSRAEINVILITQSSSEHSICVAIDSKFADAAKAPSMVNSNSKSRSARSNRLALRTGFRYSLSSATK